LPTVFSTLADAGARTILGDIRDPEARADALEGVHAVVHLAAQGSVPRSVENPEATLDVNVRATDALLEDMAARDLHRLVLASSAAVYGDLEGVPHVEDVAGVRQSPYADSKWANEQAVLRRRQEGWEALALRFFNVYGPGQRNDGPNTGVIPIFVSRMCNGMAPTLYGGGTQTRDFVHVDDVARLLVDLATKPWGAPARSVYNVGLGHRPAFWTSSTQSLMPFGHEVCTVSISHRSSDLHAQGISITPWLISRPSRPTLVGTPRSP